MQGYFFNALTYDGAVYCIGCLPAGVRQSGEDVSPIYAMDEWDSYPVCDACGEEHDYVSLTTHGRRERAQRWEGKEIQRLRADIPTNDLPLYAWPGGYPLVYLAGKSLETVCSKCANTPRYKYAEWEEDAIQAYYIHYEGAPVQCGECYEEIESAYGDPKAAKTDEA